MSKLVTKLHRMQDKRLHDLYYRIDRETKFYDAVSRYMNDGEYKKAWRKINSAGSYPVPDEVRTFLSQFGT